MINFDFDTSYFLDTWVGLRACLYMLLFFMFVFAVAAIVLVVVVVVGACVCVCMRGCMRACVHAWTLVCGHALVILNTH